MAWVLGEQFAALYIKNALVAWRNRRATILRILAPLFFMLLALAIDKALQVRARGVDQKAQLLQAVQPLRKPLQPHQRMTGVGLALLGYTQGNQDNQAIFSEVTNPEPEALNPIPQCIDDVYIGSKPCTELFFTPDNPITQAIMGNVTSRNPKPIKSIAFSSQLTANQYLLANPDSTLAGVHFIFANSSVPGVLGALEGFILQTNMTYKEFKNNKQDFNFFIQLPLQSAVQREIARWQLNQNPATRSLASTLGWNVLFTVFPHPTLSSVSIISRVLGPFVFAALMFAFVTQISTVVMEKEMGLRPAMRTMGMRDAAYWSSWAVWELGLAVITALIVYILGLIMQFDLFKKNSFGLLFFLFFLFQLSMSSLALFFSVFLKRTQPAVYLGFVVFIVGWIMQTVVIFGVPYAPEYWFTSAPSAVVTVMFSAFPWNPLMKGFNDLGSAAISANSPGLKWDERRTYCQNIEAVQDQNTWAARNGYNIQNQFVDFNCVYPLASIYITFVLLWLGYLVAAIYLDNVLPNEFGVRRPVFYFLYPSYWRPSTLHPVQALAHVVKEDTLGPQERVVQDEDVTAEESRMRELLMHRTGHTSKEGELAAAIDPRNAVEVYGLKKKYGGSNGCCGRSLICCGACDGCSCRAAPAFWPIKGSWFAIEQSQLFCLLGPNGAGKTTTINCLTGALPPTYGDALIYGQSIRSTGGMDKIRSLMGVCPQFDVLWPELSGYEHLCLYGRIKGLGWKNVRASADDLLERVKLTHAAKQRTGAYSGGMKRRLSVAIALLGDPKVVYLDEPTTGMDPISRRYVWDIIQEAKLGRAIVLTTHSMEEADILGDRISIMCLGRLKALGSSLRLKQKFGSGYEVSVSVQPRTGEVKDAALVAQHAETIKSMFKEQLGVTPDDEGKSYTTFLVPREREAALIPFLASLERQQDQLGITDIQLGLTSLEEVFLSVAKKAALEAAQGSGAQVRRKRDLPFWPVCCKASLLGLFFPITIWGVCWWKRVIVGKDKDIGPEATLPDGTTIPISPGQEFVEGPDGQQYEVMWGVDDNGHLIVTETRRADPTRVAAAQQASAAAPQPTYPAVNGKARIPLAGNVLMEVAVGNTYVMNPVDGSTYAVTWGKDSYGNDIVTACDPVTQPPAAQTMAHSGSLGNGSGSFLPPVAPPVNGSFRNSNGSAVNGSRPVGEGLYVSPSMGHAAYTSIPGTIASPSASQAGTSRMV